MKMQVLFLGKKLLKIFEYYNFLCINILNNPIQPCYSEPEKCLWEQIINLTMQKYSMTLGLSLPTIVLNEHFGSSLILESFKIRQIPWVKKYLMQYDRLLLQHSVICIMTTEVSCWQLSDKPNVS
jgi:hypothetical protein